MPRKIAHGLFLLIFLLNFSLMARSITLVSPNQKLQATITIGEQLTLALSLNGQTLLAPSPVGLSVEQHGVLGKHPVLLSQKRTQHRGLLKPVVPLKNEVIPDLYNQLTLRFEKSYQLQVRLYDSGLAYRFVTAFPDSITIVDEPNEFRFAQNVQVYFPEEESFITHSERSYRKLRLNQITVRQMSSVPILLSFKDGCKIALTESDLRDYPGLYVQGTSSTVLRTVFPKVILKIRPAERHPDRNEVVEQRATYIARTTGTRTFPWRIFMVAEQDADLLTNELVFQLAPPLKLTDVSWIHPGKVAWDWWNALNVFGVNFKSGINTETYKYYIDFAAKYHIEYVILDEGWSQTTDLLHVNPDIDMEALTQYASEKGVGLILWTLWEPLDRQLETALTQFEHWGIKGIKVDFMQRDDQWMVNYYWKIARAAARHHLLVDFHGAYKPAGLRRAYPNVITREGVKGLEHNKWSTDITPMHDVTLPFTRMLAGPMDYTPGAMVNAQKKNFRVVFERPMSQGTRCHQLAMYVVFESPLQMLADSPSHYLQNREVMELLSPVPTTWDETIPLKAKVGHYVVLARRKGQTWYLAGMNDWNARSFEIPLTFLHDGKYSALVFEDGPNAERYAEDFRKVRTNVTAKSTLSMHMASGGGWVAVLKPVNE